MGRVRGTTDSAVSEGDIGALAPILWQRRTPLLLNAVKQKAEIVPEELEGTGILIGTGRSHNH